MIKLKNILLLLLFVPIASFAILEIDIIKSEKNNIKIVIANFEGEDSQEVKISKIITDNLNRSGSFNAINSDITIKDKIDFNYWKNKDYEIIAFGKIEKINANLFNIYVYVYDIYTKKRLYSKKITTHNSASRRIAHHLSDKIYQTVLGDKGYFETRLTYVTVTKDSKGNKLYNLEISESDGFNPQTVISSYNPIFSPSWSPDQQKIAYVSFENNRSEVFIRYPFMNIRPIKLPRFDGISSSPAWHPNGKSIALTISNKGNKDIYLYNLENKKLVRLTTNSAIDTEANFSPDGKSIAFTSNRAGSAQIYIKNLLTGDVERVTFSGNYNAEPAFSPDGKSLTFIHKTGRNYRVAIIDIETRNLKIMTNNKLDESPYFSPNGSMIVFAKKNNYNKGVLSFISLNNSQIIELYKKNYDVREPSWSSYSK